ncbi:hypothetical protein cypCar_00043089 [Cyprinus carpio]|nr:hypothetical protein cypCar_00043089 [Cyprinus carpio]
MASGASKKVHQAQISPKDDFSCGIGVPPVQSLLRDMRQAAMLSASARTVSERLWEAAWPVKKAAKKPLLSKKTTSGQIDLLQKVSVNVLRFTNIYTDCDSRQPCIHWRDSRSEVCD